jgi:hypothetical protein
LQHLNQQSQQQPIDPNSMSMGGEQAKNHLSQILTDSANEIAATAGKSSITQQSMIDIDKLIDKFIEDQNRKASGDRNGMELDIVNTPIELTPAVNSDDDFLKDLPADYSEEKKAALLKMQKQNQVLINEKMERTKEKIQQHRLNLQKKLNDNFSTYATIIQAKTGRPFDHAQMKNLVDFVSGIPLLSEESQRACDILLDVQASINEKQADQVNMLLNGYKRYREVCTEQTNQLSAKDRLLAEREARLKQLEEENNTLKTRSVPYGSMPEQRFQPITANASMGSDFDGRNGKRAMTVNSRAVTGTGVHTQHFDPNSLNVLGKVAYVASKRTDPMCDEFFHQTKAIAWDGMLKLIGNETWEGKKVHDIGFFKEKANTREQREARQYAIANGWRPS